MRVTGGWGDVARSEAAPGLQRLNSTALSDLERGALPCPTPATAQSLTGSEERQASILGCCAEQADGLASSHVVRGSLFLLVTSLGGRKEEHGPAQHTSVRAKLRVHASKFKVCPSFLPLPQQTSGIVCPADCPLLLEEMLLCFHGNLYLAFPFFSFGGGIS